MDNLEKKTAFLIDMDGVVYRGREPVKGAAGFIKMLNDRQMKFLFVTNSSSRSPAQLQEKLAGMGISVTKEQCYTSAMATAAYIADVHPGAKVHVLGSEHLEQSMTGHGLKLDDGHPDYVVVGYTSKYDFRSLNHATLLVHRGARLIGTNPDPTWPSEECILPGNGALVYPIEAATGRKAFFIGKPNPLMMRQALRRLGARREDTVIIGDRMDTDIVSGIESGMDTILVLSGVTAKRDLVKFAYRPAHVFDSVADIVL